MTNKQILIGLGVLAVAGVGFYLIKNRKPSQPKVVGKPSAPPNVAEEPKSNYLVGDRLGNDCLCYGNIWSPECCKRARNRSLKTRLDL